MELESNGVPENFSKQHIDRSDQRPESYNGPQYDQLGTHMIPNVMEPQILDIRHGLHMPDVATANIGDTGFDLYSTPDPGNFYDTGSSIPNDANETQFKDPNPEDPRAHPTRR